MVGGVVEVLKFVDPTSMTMGLPLRWGTRGIVAVAGKLSVRVGVKWHEVLAFGFESRNNRLVRHLRARAGRPKTESLS